MSRAGWTGRPCHGCGEAKQHRTTGVCRECADLIAQAKKRREIVAADVGRERVLVPGAAHWWPGFYYGSNAHPRATEAVRNAVVAVLAAAGERLEVRAGYHSTGFRRATRRGSVAGDGNSGEITLLPAGLADAIADLDELIDIGLREAYELGVAAGSNLLAQLAAGTLTSPEFERRTGVSR